MTTPLTHTMFSFSTVALLAAVASAQSYTSPEDIGLGVGNRAAASASADFNHDGIPDLLTAHDLAGKLNFRAGLGTGAYGAPIVTIPAVAAAPQFLTIADFNNDGNLDLLTSGGAFVECRAGDGLGNFAGGWTFIHGGMNSGGLDSGDLDLNGLVDFVEARVGVNTAVCIGVGGAVFVNIVNYPSATNIQSVSLADVNNDNDLDFIVRAPMAMAVRFGAPGAGFGAEAVFVTPNQTEHHDTADLNNDGDLDIAVVYGIWANSCSMMGNNGAGAFPAIANFPTHLEPMRVRCGDADGDGQDDIFVVCRHLSGANLNAVLEIHQNDGAGTVYTNGVLLLNYNLQSLTIADTNDDEKEDGIVTGETAAGNGIYTLLFGQGTGRLTKSTLASGGVNPSSVATGDLNKDGHVDFAVANEGTGNVVVRFGDGAGNFSPALTLAFGVAPRDVAIADLNGDRNLDILTADFATNSVNRALGDGAGGFGAVANIPVLPGPAALAVGDLNQDGLPDVAVACEMAGAISVLFKNPGGGFFPAVNIPCFATPVDIAIADFTSDGRNELAVADPGANLLALYFNMGGGVLAGPFGVPTGGLWPSSVAIGDANRDGNWDIAVGNYNSGDVTLFRGDGAGNFPFPTMHNSGAGTRDVLLTDVTADGFAEIISVNQSGDQLVRRILTAAAPSGVNTGLNPRAVACADFTENGRVDLIVVNGGGDSVTVYLDSSSEPWSMLQYGPGTSGAAGRLCMGAPRAARVADANFNLTCTNAPARSLGLGYAGDAVDFIGSDTFGILARIHVDLFGSSSVTFFDIFSDLEGNSYAATPIPNDPMLAGEVFFIQSLWVEHVDDGRACTPALLDVVTSRGFRLKIEM